MVTFSRPKFRTNILPLCLLGSSIPGQAGQIETKTYQPTVPRFLFLQGPKKLLKRETGKVLLSVFLIKYFGFYLCVWCGFLLCCVWVRVHTTNHVPFWTLAYHAQRFGKQQKRKPYEERRFAKSKWVTEVCSTKKRERERERLKWEREEGVPFVL